ncbi:DUF2971 domain-containing protein [Porphyromonas gingivalis]|uniref:DUF2971 domain-containing protein n=1 Tax=Porphyromonas gingivalis TaxID=837 RepID=UPI000C19B50D|nr:hypothetical protein CS549_07210 [Porphyromonas gingivalis]
MWAHYADDSNGVCIVIDKEAFIFLQTSIISVGIFGSISVSANKTRWLFPSNSFLPMR